MNKYEEGGLKDQRLQKKHLVSKPEFMQQHFQPIQALPPSFQVNSITIMVLSMGGGGGVLALFPWCSSHARTTIMNLSWTVHKNKRASLVG